MDTTQTPTNSTALVHENVHGTADETNKLTLWERFSFGTAHCVTNLLLRVVGLSGLYRFGRLFGTIEWLINYKRRRRFRRALQRVLNRRPSASDRRRETREFFCRTRCDKLFYLIIDCLPHDKIASLLNVENHELLASSLEGGRGVYLAMSHHGPHHVMGALLVASGYKTAAVRDRNEGGIRRYVQGRIDRKHSASHRMRVIFADAYPREIYRCFREGYILGSAMDISRVRNPNQQVEEVTIFGEKRAFLSGPLKIAARSRTPVLQAFIKAESHFRYTLSIVEQLIQPAAIKGDEDAIIRNAMQTYATNVEKQLQATPSLLARI